MRAVRLLNTIYGSTAIPGDIIEVDDKRAEELIAGKEAVALTAPKPAETDVDSRFAKALEGAKAPVVDKGEA